MVQDFLSNVQSVDISSTDVPESKGPFYCYKVAKRAGVLSVKSFKTRFKVVLGKCLENIPLIPTKEDPGAFDYGQKLVIYYRDRGECKECGKKVEFGEAEFHHVKGYEQGDNTILRMGLLYTLSTTRGVER